MDHGTGTSLSHVQRRENWARLHLLIEYLPTEEGRTAHHRLLETLAEDVVEGPAILLGFRRAPAAKRNHHAHEGGLTQHLLEMWDLWLRLEDELTSPPHVTRARVLTAIILHDLHKAHRTYELLSTDPWEVRYYNDPTDMLMTTDVKSLWLAQRAGLNPDPEQINALLWAEGGFSKTRPRWCSVLAKVCYALDELSGNGRGRIKARTLLNHDRQEPPLYATPASG